MGKVLQQSGAVGMSKFSMRGEDTQVVVLRMFVYLSNTTLEMLTIYFVILMMGYLCLLSASYSAVQ